MSANKESRLVSAIGIVAPISGVIITLITIKSYLPFELFCGLLTLLASAIFITVSFVFLKPSYDRRVEQKKVKIMKLESCKSSIRMTTNYRVKKDDWKYSPDVAYTEFHPELDARIRRFVDDYLRCSDLFSACEYAIRHVIRDKAVSRLPKTNNITPLDGLLMRKEEMVTQLVNGRSLTESWIKENHPEIHKELIERLADPQTDLNTFFYELNKMLENNKVLVRFRKEKEELIKLSESIQGSLDEEIKKFK